MKILFFSPHASIWEHAFPEALVSEALQKAGHEVVYISCGGTFQSYCVSMAAQSIRFGASANVREQVCLRCNANRDLLRRRFGLRGYDLGTALNAEDHSFADSSIEKLDRGTFGSFQLDGVPVGKIALYETILHNKKQDFDFSPSEWEQYLASAKNTILSLRAAQRILDREKPDAVVNYGSLYSVNHVWRVAAEQRGITPYLVQGGASLAEVRTKMNVVVDRATSGLPYYADLLNKWPTLREVPASPTGIASVTRHFLHLFSGGDFVFSAPKKGVKVRERFGVAPDQKLILATLSSYDEIFGAEAVGFPQFHEKLLFASQADWVTRLKEYFSSKPEYFLVIRPHPREFGVKGNSVVSDNVKRLNEALGNLPKNIAVNTPRDEISIYDFAEEVDLVLNGWSTVGSELPLFGIPVVGYTDIGWFPSDLDFIGKTEEEYFALIERALVTGWSSDRIKIAYRWFALLFDSGSIDLSQYVSSRKYGLKSALTRGLKDPVWALEDLMDRAKAFWRPMFIRTANQRQDCRRVGSGGRWMREVSELFETGKISLLELRMKELTSEDPDIEAREIRESMRLISEAMRRGNGAISPLQVRLERFVRGEG